MKRTARVILGLAVALFLLGMVMGCGKTEIGYVQTDPEKYVGKEVTIEGWTAHNLSEIEEYKVNKARAERRYRERGGLPPVYVRPEEFNYIVSNKGLRYAPTAGADLARGLGDKKAGVINAKYEVSPPKSNRKVRVTGIVKLKEEYRNLIPVLVVKSWKYIQSAEEEVREKYKKHIIGG